MTRAKVTVSRNERGEEIVEFAAADGARVRVSLPAPRHDVPAEIRARAAIGAIAAEARADRLTPAERLDEGLDETFPASDPVAASDPAIPSRRKD